MSKKYKKLFLIFTISICILLFGCSTGDNPDEPQNYTIKLVYAEQTIHLEQGSTKQLEVITENISTDKLTWTSDTPSVASIKNGLVAANNPGAATITVSYKNTTSYLFINVYEKEGLKDVELYTIYTEYNEANERDEEYVYMGYYPQTRIKNPDILNELNKLSTTNENGYYEFNGSLYQKVIIENKYANYRDWDFSDNRYSQITGLKVGETAYYKVEPIKWRILYHDIETNQLLLMTTSILDTCIFQDEQNDLKIDNTIIYPTNYEKSDVRNWLLNDFYNTAFNDYDDSIIIPTLIENDPTSIYEIDYPVIDTTDKVFLPSYDDVTSALYGFEVNGYISKTRSCTTSDYAISQGATPKQLGENTSGLWLLRWGLYYTKHYSSIIDYEGYAIEKSLYLDQPNLGIRVCMNVDATKIN